MKTYGRGDSAFTALRGVDLAIRRGEFVAVMGPSGSGKSTLINILGCLDTPNAGAYRHDGIAVETLSADERALLRRHALGFIFQGFNLLARTSALENVELPLLYCGLPRRQRREKAVAALAAVGLRDKLANTPTELSGGQQQRVAIARSLVTEPGTLLADEPTGNLDSAVLTVLGVVIGVAAVITLVTLGRAAIAAVKGQISNLGSNLVMLRPGSGFAPLASAAGAPAFTLADVNALGEQVAGVAALAPVRQTPFSTVHGREARSTNVTGTTRDYFAINRRSLADGRFFTEAEQKSGAAVAVIGATVRAELSGEADPIGARIRVGTASLEVIGLLQGKGQGGMGDQDDTLVVPLSAFQRRLAGREGANDIGLVTLSAEDDAEPRALLADITALMRQRRNLQPGQENDFNVFDTRQIAETLGASTKLMTGLLGAVAAVSLLVGSIGIMNIMLVSVTERTREIGIHLAIGATAHEVRLQFLVEARRRAP